MTNHTWESIFVVGTDIRDISKNGHNCHKEEEKEEEQEKKKK